MRVRDVCEVVVGVLVGFLTAGVASALGWGISYLILSPFHGPFM